MTLYSTSCDARHDGSEDKKAGQCHTYIYQDVYSPRNWKWNLSALHCWLADCLPIRGTHIFSGPIRDAVRSRLGASGPHWPVTLHTASHPSSSPISRISHTLFQIEYNTSHLKRSLQTLFLELLVLFLFLPLPFFFLKSVVLSVLKHSLQTRVLGSWSRLFCLSTLNSFFFWLWIFVRKVNPIHWWHDSQRLQRLSIQTFRYKERTLSQVTGSAKCLNSVQSISVDLMPVTV